MTPVAKIWNDILWVPHFQFLQEWNVIQEQAEDCTNHGDLVCLWLNTVSTTVMGIESMNAEMNAYKFIKLIPLKFK